NSTVNFIVSDGELSRSNSFLLIINTLPSISSPGPQTMDEDTTKVVNLTVGDAETAVASLTLSANSSNPGLLPNSGLVPGGFGSSRTVTLKPATNQFGTANVTVTVSDNTGGYASNTFTVTINSVNDFPTISMIAAQTTAEDTSLTVPF